MAGVVVVAVVAFVLAAPLTFHLGGRWMPLGQWSGVARLRDSAGEQYGLYVRFGPYVRIGLRQ